jgi:TM2 domain-containing membrane protein YozV
MSSLTAPPPARRVDADFASEILADLYGYRRKNRVIAYLLWGTLGWFGAHRFYLERPATGLLMLASLGGGLLWWIVDGFLIRAMVEEHNAEQARRRRLGLPPLELGFMPPLSRGVLDRPPEWTRRWEDASGRRRAARLAGDVLVLLAAGYGLGLVGRRFGVAEAIVPIAVLLVLTAAGTGAGWMTRVPLLRSLVAWGHKLRLFYYYNTPGSPIALLFRPVTGVILAPFRQRARAEVRLYLELGAVFTLLFLLEDLAGALIAEGTAALAPLSLLRLWVGEVVANFLTIYAFATPIGAVLTLYLLVRPTHTAVRLLSVLAAVAIVAGLMA